jgi:signal peptidase I
LFSSHQQIPRQIFKRIVGLPGERLKISHGQVYINGVALDENYLPSGTFTGPETFLKDNQEIVIPQDYYFVMGDNRMHSSDSRDFGPIPKKTIVGKVVYRFWPPARTGSF